MRSSGILVSLAIGLGLAFAACSQPAPPQSPATSVAVAAGTVQSAGTQIVATVQAAGSTVSAAQTQAVPAVAAAQTQVAPTVAAVQSQVAPTVAAVQSQVAPTVAAVQTQLAPTISAIQTQVSSTVQPAVASAVAASPIQISQVQVSQADTTIGLRNSGTVQVSVGGWVLFMGTFPYVLPTGPNMRIDPGQTLTLHFSRGTDTPTDVYVGQAPGPLVNNLQNGATLALVQPTGQLMSVYRIP